MSGFPPANLHSADIIRFFCLQFPEIVYAEGQQAPTRLAAPTLSPSERGLGGPGSEAAHDFANDASTFAGSDDGESVRDVSMTSLPVVPRDTYMMKKLIGRNPTTVVFLAERTGDNLEVAVKFVQLNDAKQMSYAQSEVRCLANCTHFGIIRQFECVMRDTTLLLVMEYGSGGDLAKQLKQRAKENLPFKEHEVGLLLLQIIMAVDHVHSRKMMHRDIKTQNIFLMPTGIVKLGDFGLSKQYEESVSADVGTSFCGTPFYLAPEIWQRKRYSKKADMWSIGVVLYELITMRRPFVGPAQHQIMDQVLNAAYEPLPPTTAPELREIVEVLLQRDPTMRPTTTQLLQMQFFKYAKSIFEEIVTVSDAIPPPDKQLILQYLGDSRRVPSGLINSASGLGASPTSRSGPLLLPPTAPVRYGGYLLKLGGDRRWKKRYFAITNTGQLRISLTENVLEDKAAPQSAPLDMIVEVMPVPSTYAYHHPHQLSIWFSTTKKIVATAGSDRERDEWIDALHEALGVL